MGRGTPVSEACRPEFQPQRGAQIRDSLSLSLGVNGDTSAKHTGTMQITEKDWKVQRPRAQQTPLLEDLLEAMGSQAPLIFPLICF